FEGNEMIVLDLQNPIGGAVLGATTQHTLTILEDEVLPTVEFKLVNSAVGEANATHDILVSLSGASDQVVSVEYAIAGTATNGGSTKDYELTTGWVTFPALSSADQTITLSIFDDSWYEGNETVILTLQNEVNAQLGSNNPHTVTINDDETLPVVQYKL